MVVLGFVKLPEDKTERCELQGRKMTGVTDKQIKELGIESARYIQKPDSKSGALFESQTASRYFLLLIQR